MQDPLPCCVLGRNLEQSRGVEEGDRQQHFTPGHLVYPRELLAQVRKDVVASLHQGAWGSSLGQPTQRTGRVAVHLLASPSNRPRGHRDLDLRAGATAKERRRPVSRGSNQQRGGHCGCLSGGSLTGRKGQAH